MSQKSNFNPENQDGEPIKSQISGKYTNGKRKAEFTTTSVTTNSL